MRRRGLLAVPALLASMALGAPAAQADDALKMYRVTVDDRGVGKLAELGVDIGHTGYDHSKKIAQTIFVDLIDQQAREARADGLGLTEVTPGPHVTETEISKRIASAKGKSRAAAKPETGGDSPNQFYDVYRTYSEPGGIKDEMTSLAAQYPGLAKLVVIGKSGQGQDIVALKVTKDARNVQGRRPSRDAVLGRQPRPRVDRGRGRPAHADVVARALRRARDRRPARPRRAVVPADPEPGRLRLHLHLRHRLPHRQQPDVRRDAGHRPGRPAARHLRLQDRRRHHPRAQRRAAEHGAAHADPAPVAQDAARQRRQRDLRRRPGRRRRRTATTRRPGAWTRRARQAARSPAAPTAARSRSQSPRTWRTTGCCAGSRPRP